MTVRTAAGILIARDQRATSVRQRAREDARCLPWMVSGRAEVEVPRTIALAVLAVLTTGPAQALQQRLSRRELAARSDHVVAVQVLSSQARLTAGGHDITTLVELAVLSRQRGDLPARAVLELEGGRVGAAQVWVEDVPWLQPDQRYALFLLEPARGRLAILGGLQGAVRLRDDDGTGPGETWAAFVQSLPLDLHPPLSVGDQPHSLAWFATNGHDWSYQLDPVEEPFSINLSSFGLDPLALMARFDAALAVWTQESGAQLWLRSGGDTGVLQFGDMDDDHNVLMGEDYHFGSTLSVAVYRSLGEQMLDCDVRFYARNSYGTIAWSVGPEGAAAGENDLQQTMTHELGHCLGLSHSDVAGAIMYPTVGSGTGDERRHLQADDIAGIQWLYGVRTSWPDAGGLDATADAASAHDAARPDSTATGLDAGAPPVDAATTDAVATDAVAMDGVFADAVAPDVRRLDGATPDRGGDTAAPAGCGCQAARTRVAAPWLLLAFGMGRLRRCATSRRASAR